MKIIRQSPDELIVESRPWLAGIVITVLTLILAGVALAILMNGAALVGGTIIVMGGALSLAAFWAFVRLEEVRFSRSDGAVQFRTRSIGGRQEDTIPLDSVQGAILQSRVRREGSKSSSGKAGVMREVRMSRPALRMAPGLRAAPVVERPLTEVYTSDVAVHQAIVTAVNDWLAQGRTGAALDSGPAPA